MKTQRARAVSMGLLAAGLLGMCLSSFGAMPQTTVWSWLVVLLLGVFSHVAVEDRAAKARVARRFRRELGDIAENLRLVERAHGGRLEELDRVLRDYLATWGPVQQENRDAVIRQLQEVVAPLVDEQKRAKAAASLTSAVARR